MAYKLSESEFTALSRVASDVGDKQVFVTLLETSIPDPGFAYTAFDLGDYGAYNELDIIGETAIYSPCGLWGVLISHLDHAVVAGVPSFTVPLVASLAARGTPAATRKRL